MQQFLQYIIPTSV